MTLVSSQVRVAGTGEVFVAPTATAAPTDATTALAAGFIGLGYTSENGVVMKRSVDREAIPAWQSVTPIRFVYNGLDLSIQAEFIQSNKDILKLYLASGDFSVVNVNEHKADIPTVPTRDIRSLCVQWTDSTITNRLYIPQVEVSETGDANLAKNAATAFGLTFSAVAPTGGSVLATFFTNDPAFA